MLTTSTQLYSAAAGSTREASDSPALGVIEDMKLTMEPFLLELSPVLAEAIESLSLSKTLLKAGFAAVERELVLRRVWTNIEDVGGARGSEGSTVGRVADGDGLADEN